MTQNQGQVGGWSHGPGTRRVGSFWIPLLPQHFHHILEPHHNHASDPVSVSWCLSALITDFSGDCGGGREVVRGLNGNGKKYN